MYVARLTTKLAEAAEQSKRYSERHFTAFGYIALVLIPATTFIEQIVADPEFNTAYVRVCAATAGVVVLVRNKLPAQLKEHFALVWVLLATFVLPVCFGLILTLNAAMSAPGSSISPIWVYQYLAAIFIFVQLIHNALLSFVLWLAASIPLAFSLLFIDTPNQVALSEALVLPLPVFLTALIIGSFANRNIQMIQTEKLKAASAIGSNIAHELRTPLASIGILSRAVQRYLPELVDGYEQAIDSNAIQRGISPFQLTELRRALHSIRGEVEYSNTIINILLANTSDSPLELSKSDQFFASQAIAEAVLRYPFNNSDERRILESSTQNDFLLNAPYILIVHVLFNLIKNAIYYAQSHRDGIVKVFSGVHEGRKAIFICDTGCGISDSMKSKVFDRFFTTTEAGQGAGIGLSFCKMVMEGIGGEIQCESKEGQYTTFRLIFPEVS
jgi:two-component system CAI-1 autoinducer sensor kinase/phosphatase CqsS